MVRSSLNVAIVSLTLLSGCVAYGPTHSQSGAPNSCYYSPYGTVIVRGPCPYTSTNRYRYGLPPSRFPECEVYPTYGERRACHAGVIERERANQQSYNSQAYQNGKTGYHP